MLAIASACGVAYIVGILSQLNYNSWYGEASKDLIDTIVLQLEAGNEARVESSLRKLSEEFQPTYENRANYDDLVKQAVRRMKD